MENQRRLESRTFMNGTRVIGIPCVGACIIVTIVASFLLCIAGIIMAIVSPNYPDCIFWNIYNYICRYRMSDTRIAGIALSIIGGLILIVSLILALKARRDNQVIAGKVLIQTIQPAQQGMYPGGPVPANQAYQQNPPMGYPHPQNQPLLQNTVPIQAAPNQQGMYQGAVAGPMVYPLPEAQPVIQNTVQTQAAPQGMYQGELPSAPGQLAYPANYHNPPVAPNYQNPPMAYHQAQEEPTLQNYQEKPTI